MTPNELLIAVYFIKRYNTIDDEENELPKSKEAPAPFAYETSKQDEINKQINVENRFLFVLYKKKQLNQMMKNDQKQTKTRQANLEKLKKKLNDLKLSRKRLKKNPLECNENYFLFNR